MVDEGQTQQDIDLIIKTAIALSLQSTSIDASDSNNDNGSQQSNDSWLTQMENEKPVIKVIKEKLPAEPPPSSEKDRDLENRQCLKDMQEPANNEARQEIVAKGGHTRADDDGWWRRMEVDSRY